jgi:hypothetical protein
MLGSLARADPDTYIAAVRTLIVGFVLLFLVVGNVSAAVHGHTSAAGSEVLLHAGDAPGSDPGWPPACEICTHGLSSPADGPNAIRDCGRLGRTGPPTDLRNLQSLTDD